MAIIREKHTINGKVQGMFYTFGNGDCLYMAWRSGEKSKSLFIKGNAWCLDVDVLRMAERRGCTAIGIAHKVRGTVMYYLTNLADYLNPPSERHPNSVTLQRRLSRDKFLVNTALSPTVINKAMKIR